MAANSKIDDTTTGELCNLQASIKGNYDGVSAVDMFQNVKTSHYIVVRHFVI